MLIKGINVTQQNCIGVMGVKKLHLCFVAEIRIREKGVVYKVFLPYKTKIDAEHALRYFNGQSIYLPLVTGTPTITKTEKNICKKKQINK